MKKNTSTHNSICAIRVCWTLIVKAFCSQHVRKIKQEINSVPLLLEDLGMSHQEMTIAEYLCCLGSQFVMIWRTCRQKNSSENRIEVILFLKNLYKQRESPFVGVSAVQEKQDKICSRWRKYHDEAAFFHWKYWFWPALPGRNILLSWFKQMILFKFTFKFHLSFNKSCLLCMHELNMILNTCFSVS